MTTYIPDLADEVLVTRGPHAGGVGTITDIEIDKVTGGTRFYVEGLTPAGNEFSRWHVVAEITPAEWGTWRIEITTGGNPRTLLRTDDITDRPVEPVEMVLETLHEVPWYVLELDGKRLAVAVQHIETVEVLVTARRDHR